MKFSSVDSKMKRNVANGILIGVITAFLIIILSELVIKDYIWNIEKRNNHSKHKHACNHRFSTFQQFITLKLDSYKPYLSPLCAQAFRLYTPVDRVFEKS